MDKNTEDNLKKIAKELSEKTGKAADMARDKITSQGENEKAKKTSMGSKKNIWKIIIIIILLVAVFESCGNNCKERGCHEKLYKDGYCRAHFMMHIADEYLDDYYNPDYGK